MDVSNISDHIQIKIKMPNPSQEPPTSSKAPNQDLKDIDVLCTLEIKIWKKGSSKTSDHIQIKIKKPKTSQAPPMSSRTQNEDLKDIDIRELAF